MDRVIDPLASAQARLRAQTAAADASKRQRSGSIADRISTLARCAGDTSRRTLRFPLSTDAPIADTDCDADRREGLTVHVDGVALVEFRLELRQGPSVTVVGCEVGVPLAYAVRTLARHMGWAPAATKAYLFHPCAVAPTPAYALPAWTPAPAKEAEAGPSGEKGGLPKKKAKK